MLYGRRHTSRREMRERAMHCLDIVGLSNSRRPHAQPALGWPAARERPSHAGLSNEPQVALLADEPTGNLDSKTSTEVMGVFQN